MVAGDVSVRRARARVGLPAVSFRVGSALAATAVAGLAVVVGLSVSQLPGPGFSVVLFTAAPLCGLVALVVLHQGVDPVADPGIGWVVHGLAVGCLALLLQLVSFPAVSAGGGPFGTRGEGSALLYLTCHVFAFGCAAAGAGQVSPSWQRPVLAAGLVTVLAQTLNVFPSPRLLTDEQVFTPTLVAIEWVLVAVGMLCLAGWVIASGRRPSPLRGWVAVFLLLLIYQLVLNAVAGRRFDPLWWSSVSLRVAAFAALAAGCLVATLRRAQMVETYSATELRLRDAEVRDSAAVIDQLLLHARELAAARTPTEVALAVCRAAQTLTGAPFVVVSHTIGDAERLVRLVGTQAGGLPAAWHEQPMIPQLAGTATTARFVSSRVAVQDAQDLQDLQDLQDIDAAVADARSAGPMARRVNWALPVEAYAVLPMLVGQLQIGTLEVAAPAPRRWSDADREVLRGLVDQAGPVLSRARLAEREHAAAQTLQRSLLPPRLPTVPGLVLAAAYQPAALEHEVGGDWYDAWTLPDGRTALVVGDVVGKGLRAAATTGRLRAAIRALAGTDPSPDHVLQQLDRLESDDGPTMTATVIYALIDADLATVTIASAGHLPALLVSAEFDPQHPALAVPDDVGAPIGLGAFQQPATTVALPPGGALLMYTDGLIETRTTNLDDRIHTLAELAAIENSRPEHSGDRLPQALMRQLKPAGDDVAVLTATRVHHPSSSPSPSDESTRS